MSETSKYATLLHIHRLFGPRRPLRFKKKQDEVHKTIIFRGNVILLPQNTHKLCYKTYVVV